MPPLYSGEDCDSQLVAHNCNPCPTVNQREFGRVRSVFYVFADYHATLLAGILDPEVWRAGIAAGKIIVIPETSGEYDPGDPKALKGYGDRVESYGPRTATLHYFDPNLVDNYEHYNSLGGQTELIPGFRTSSQIRLFDTPAAITAKDPVADDIESEVAWDVSAKVITNSIPVYHPAATLLNTVFKCSWINAIDVTDPVTDYDTEATFVSDDEFEGAGVYAKATTIGPNIGLSFNALSPLIGTPNDMSIYVGSELQMIVTFPSDYSASPAKPFKFVDDDGVVHTSTFKNGDVNF